MRWSERQESNLRPTACKAVALPIELHSDCFMASRLGFEPRLQGFGDLPNTVILPTYIHFVLETTDGIAPTLLGLQLSAHLSMPSRHLCGRAGWTRTGNPRNQNPLHYLCATAQLFWWRRLESNQQCLPFGTDLQSAATPPSLPPLQNVWSVMQDSNLRLPAPKAGALPD